MSEREVDAEGGEYQRFVVGGEQLEQGIMLVSVGGGGRVGSGFVNRIANGANQYKSCSDLDNMRSVNDYFLSSFLVIQHRPQCKYIGNNTNSIIQTA